MKFLENWAFNKTAKRIHQIISESGYSPLGLTVSSWRFYWLTKYLLHNGNFSLEEMGDKIDGKIVKLTVRGVPVYRN